MNTSRLRRRLGSRILLMLGLSGAAGGEALAQTARHEAGVNDGPYARWRTPNELDVWWVCEGQAQRELHRVVDRLSIPMKCGDPRLAITVDTSPPTPGPAEFSDVNRLIAVGDVHGEYEALCDLLVGSGVINAELDWTWGDGHLVVCGDVFDRGDRVTESLWLIHQLERQAARHGGRVHLLLGNHEIMVLQGDLRYVHKNYLDVVSRELKTPYPELFGPETELGRWLRTKPVLVKIDDLLFVHAGLGPSLAGLGLSIDRINDLVRANVDSPAEARRSDDRLHLLFGRLGPVWYRGYFLDEQKYEPADTATVRRILRQFGARAVVTAHTKTEHIMLHHDGAVIAIHAPMGDDFREEALLCEDGRLFRVADDGQRRELP